MYFVEEIGDGFRAILWHAMSSFNFFFDAEYDHYCIAGNSVNSHEDSSNYKSNNSTYQSGDPWILNLSGCLIVNQ